MFLSLNRLTKNRRGRWFGRAPQSRHPSPVRRARPAVEALEDRFAPAVITVNSTADVLNPAAGTVTLRSAIQTANTNGDASNTINLSVAGTYKITLGGTAG